MSRKDERWRAACRQYAGITHRKAFVQGAAWADSHPIKHKERTERYCKHFCHANGAYWCDKGVFPVDCANCDKADWIEYTVTTTTTTTYKEKGSEQ